MKPSKAERDEKVHRLLEALTEKMEEGAPLLVEGPRDVEALKRVGVKGRIISVKATRLSLRDVAKRIKPPGGEVILLMDFDRAGAKLASTLARHLEAEGFQPNLSFWIKLKDLMERQVKDIEGLISYLENVKREAFL